MQKTKQKLSIVETDKVFLTEQNVIRILDKTNVNSLSLH